MLVKKIIAARFPGVAVAWPRGRNNSSLDGSLAPHAKDPSKLPLSTA